MNLQEEYTHAVEGITIVFDTAKYKRISIISGIFIFSFLYYFFVAKVADNDIWISVMMSGEVFVTFSIVMILLTSLLSGILLSMILFKFSLYNRLEGKGVIGFIGASIAAFGVGCPTCGAYLFGLIGMPLALLYFPFRGLELQVIGVCILLLSIYFTAKSIQGTCSIKK